MSKLSEFYGAKVKFSRFTSPGTWTNPGSVDVIRITASAGGGGASPLIGGGGGAACNRASLHVNGSPVPVTVGTGGAANANGADTIVGPTTNRVRLQGGRASTVTAPLQRAAVGGGAIASNQTGPIPANFIISCATTGGAFAAGGIGIGTSATYMPQPVAPQNVTVGAAPFGYSTSPNGLTSPTPNNGGDGIFGKAGQANSGAGGNRPVGVGQAGAVIIEWEE